MIIKPIHLLILLCLLALCLWSTIAIYFMLLPATKIAVIAATLFAFNLIFLTVLLPYKKTTVLIAIGLCALVFIYWKQLKPSHEKDWIPSVAQRPYARITENKINIFNIRNFTYTTETDFKVRYYNQQYDLNTLQTVDYILSYWDGNEAIAHVILSFGFTNGEQLAVSVETRLEQGEQQSGLAGFFNQYELIYILADENDVIRLRSNFRKEKVYLYPTTIDKKKVRKLFDVVISSVNNLHQKAEFYNTITDNCYSSLASKFKNVNTQKAHFDYRKYALGYSDEMLYEQGDMDTDLSFKQAKMHFYINQYVDDKTPDKDFSRTIRPQKTNPN
jgi:hypothetical protein